MYCPSCKAEYRPGFTVCADCDVELVYELPEETPEEDPFEEYTQAPLRGPDADLVAI